MALSKVPKTPHLTRAGNGLAGELWSLRQEASAAISALTDRIFPPTPITDLYVSALNGSDSNTGLSPSSPLASIVAAEALLPSIITTRVRIHIGRAGLGSESYAFPSFRRRELRGDIVLVGDGAGQSGAAGVSVIEVLPSTAAEAPDSGQGSVQVAGTGWTVNAFENKTIEILSGAAAGDRKMINSNTATRIYVDGPFSQPVANGDLFRITGPTAVIGVPDVAVGESILVEGCGTPDTSSTVERLNSSFVLMNIGFTPVSPSGTVGFNMKNSAVCFFGVEISGATTIQIRTDGSSLSIGQNATDATRALGVYGFSDLGAPNSNSWLGWGFGSPGASGASTAQSFSSGNIDGYICTTRGLTCRDGARLVVRGGRIVSKSASPALQVTNLGLVYLLGGATTPIVLEGLSTSVGGICYGYDLAKIAMANVTINGSVAGISGIHAQFGTIVECSGGITGTCGGYGLLAMFGGVIKHSGAFGGLTGTLGTISVDNHTPSAITDLTSSGKEAQGHGQIVRL